MKLGQRKPAKARRRALGWVLLAIAAALGLASATATWRPVPAGTEAQERWSGRLQALVQRAQTGPAVEIPTLVIDMAFADYNTLLDQREAALTSGGIHIATADDFVNGDLHTGETTSRARIRLQEGLLTDLGPDAPWPFEVRVDDDAAPVLGFRRFYLQDPVLDAEDGGGLTRWAFGQALQREGLLTARYRFVRLIFNGDDRGLYAVQEGFDEALLTDQGHPAGVVVAFDADRLWKAIARFEGNAEAAFADPVTHLTDDDLRYFEIDTYRDAAIAADPALTAQKETALNLLYALQMGERQASEVFNVAQYGRFLALVDLWGVTEAASLVNLSYAYNAAAGLLEPIGFTGSILGTGDRISLAATYNDPQIQAAYVREAVRVSDPQYLDALQADMEPAWAAMQATLGSQGAGFTPPWDRLRERQTLMRRSLNPPRPILAYLETPAAPPYDVLRVEVQNVLNLPVEILGFDVNGATFLEADPAWIAGESQDSILAMQTPVVVLRAYEGGCDTASGCYVRINVPLTAIHAVDAEVDFNQPLDLRVAVRLLGAMQTHLVPARLGVAETAPFEPGTP